MATSKKGKSQVVSQNDFEEDDEVLMPEAIDDSFMQGLAPKAVAFAKKAYEGQVCEDGRLYYDHVERVARVVLKQCDIHASITALLQGVLAYSNTTVEELEQVFSEVIAKDVYILTKQEDMDFETYMKRIVIKYVPFYVTLVNRLDNLKTLSSAENHEAYLKYKSETSEVFIPIVKAARYAHLPEFAQVIKDIEMYT
jgi:(p)ppGpp synthase/HD superfamily hydrolase